MSRTILIGGTGFVGSAIRRELGDVLAPTRQEADLARTDSLTGLLEAGDVVINAAGYASAAVTSRAGFKRLWDANVQGVANLAEACRYRDVGQLIHISSVAAMGYLTGTNLREDDQGSPRTPYARSKLEGELRLKQYADAVPITILRPTSVFGEGRELALGLCRVAALPLIPLPGGGAAMVPFTHVDNVAHAVTLAIGNTRCMGKTFIVGDRQSYRLRDILVGLSTAMGRSPRTISVPIQLVQALARVERSASMPFGRTPTLSESRVAVLTQSLSYSIDAFVRAVGYSPPVDFRTALGRLGEWYQASRA